MFQSFDIRGETTATPQRLAALRQRLAELDVQGFLVPRADAHQGENVAPHDERLTWLTGFTGSAGVAVVLSERAALFVDGRYTLQAAQQVDTSLFEIVPIHETTVADWIGQALGKGERLGFDAWLHGLADIDRLSETAKKQGADLISLEANPIDHVWQDQPPPPVGSVRIHPLDIAGEPATDKRARIGKSIAEAGADCAVLSLPDSIAWLLNIRGSDIARSPVAHGFALAHKDGRVDLVMAPGKLDGEVRAHLGNDVTVHAPDDLPGLIAAAPGPVLLDKTTCPLWFQERLAAANRDIVWGRDPCVLPKAIKNTTEQDGMRAAHLRDGAAMVRFLHWLDRALAAGQTLTEIDIVTSLETIRTAPGDLNDISFETICGTGPNGAIVHYRVSRASNRTLVPGELLLVDSGGQYPDGTTDITRTMATGPVAGDAAQQFTRVLKGMIAMSRIRWPKGLRGRDLDALARAALWRAGFDYDHGTGHGVGACLNVHEGPQSLSRRGEAVLEPGMIVSNEPGYYREGAYGIRIENLLIVSPPSVPEGGERDMLSFETITWCPIDRNLVDTALLDAEERDWLDAYHAEVLSRIGPLVEGDTRAWLEAACAPL